MSAASICSIDGAHRWTSAGADDDGGRDLQVLMAAYQQGDAEAFERLYPALAPVLRRRLAALARDASWVDDLLQETFLQLHRTRCSYDPSLPVRPWALGIAHHVFLMSRRARTRRHDLARPDADALDRLKAPGHEHPCLLKVHLARSLEVLTPGTRRAVVLHHGVGLSLREVARALGITHAAAKLRVGRGVAAARRVTQTRGQGTARGSRPRRRDPRVA